MAAAPLPADEQERVRQLAACAILDTPPDAAFDDIAQLARLICDTPMALVSMVDMQRQWFKARVGLELGETPRDHSFCAHALEQTTPLVIADAQADPRFRDNPLVTGEPFIRFYAGVPIRLGAGSALGTLCVLDTKPRALTAAQLEALSVLARRVERELELVRTAHGGSPGQPRRVSGTYLAPGAVLGERYEVERLVGEGGMGRVYFARDTRTGAPVAVKVLSEVVVHEGEAMERFVREAQLLARVGGEHVARLLDVGNLLSGAPYLVIEHLEGYDLAHRPVRQLPVAQAARFVREACEPVTRAHAAGIIHRDLKPANLFVAVSPNGKETVKLLDFGIAKLVAPDASERPEAVQPPGAHALTSAAAVLGSPLYMSPEQMLSSRDVDATADIWALGVVLYELLTDAHPFEGESLTAICASVFLDRRIPLRSRRPDIPDALEAVVARCLAREKERRWPTANALADALAPLA